MMPQTHLDLFSYFRLITKNLPLTQVIFSPCLLSYLCPNGIRAVE